MKKRNITILILIFILIIINIFLIFFYIKESKNSKIGNNTSSQEIVNNILNINSYEAEIQVEINGSKNTNKYRIKQNYEGENKSSQEILEPSNINGVKITRNGNQLKLENTKLNLSSIFENYEYLSDNNLDLGTFIKEYKADEKSQANEDSTQIILSTKKSEIEKKLIIDKTTQKPIKLEIQDINKKTSIYISYNEINIK